MALDRTSNGYLVELDIWSEEIMLEMAKKDNLELTDNMINQIKVVCEYFDENSFVSPIRTFAKPC